jgi:Ser/Thr protein kinase RdoA (MazF antagonist)
VGRDDRRAGGVTAAAQVYVPAARQALAAFGVEPAELRFVNLSENVTFRVTDARGGAPLVLRMHRPWYHGIGALKSEHMWTRALVQAGIAVPDPLATPGGESFVQVEIAAMGERRWAGLARWREGELLDDVVARDPDIAANARCFAQIGAITAAMHDQATRWTPPAGFQRHVLDADGLMGAAPRWGPFWDHAVFSPAERDELLATRDRLHAALSRYERSDRNFGMIHADLHPGNVLVDSGRASVIDFDDAGFGWHLYDIAVALVAYQEHPGFDALREAYVAGYRSVRMISDRDLALLPMFLLIRDLAQVGWFHQRPELGRMAAAQRHRERILTKLVQFHLPI